MCCSSVVWDSILCLVLTAWARVIYSEGSQMCGGTIHAWSELKTEMSLTSHLMSLLL